MFNPDNFKILPVLFAAALLLAACGKDDDQPDAAAAVSASDSILQYIPADSPYVITTLTPLPDDLMDKLERNADRVMAAYKVILTEMVNSKRSEMSPAERNSEEAQRVDALVGEVSNLLSLDGLRGAGFARDSRFAIYGNGLLPVMRFELTDGALFDDTIANLEAKAGQQMLVGDIDGQSYRYFDADEFRIVIAVIEDQAVLSVMPNSFDSDQTGRMLGLTLPAQDLASTNILQALLTDYDFSGHFVGFVDVAQVVEAFIGEPTGLTGDLMAALAGDEPQLSDVCKAEIRELAGVMPRLVMGYTDADASRVSSSVILELRDDLASGLTGLPAAVPGLGSDAGGLLSFGLGLDIGAAQSFIEGRLDAIEADPFECAEFAELQAGAAQMRQSLDQQVMPMIYDFRGFLAIIDAVEGLDIASQTPPTSVDGSFLLAMNNAPALLAFASMASPEFAALNLQPGGDPVALDIPQLQMMGISGYAALADNAVAVSIGDGAESKVVAVLGADSADPPPFMSLSVDAARYYEFLGAAIAQGRLAQADDADDATLAATQDMMTAFAALYDRMSVDVLFTDNGIEIPTSATLKD